MFVGAWQQKKKPTFWNLETDIMKPQNKTTPQTRKVYWAPTAGLQGTVSWPGRAELSRAFEGLEQILPLWLIFFLLMGKTEAPARPPGGVCA